MYSAYSIANALIKRARKGRIPDLGPFKLQKLLLFAPAKHLKIHGTPLFEDTFIRGTHGPALPSIRHQVKAYRGHPITIRDDPTIGEVTHAKVDLHG